MRTFCSIVLCSKILCSKLNIGLFDYKFDKFEQLTRKSNNLVTKISLTVNGFL